jgi:hypothetical protein
MKRQFLVGSFVGLCFLQISRNLVVTYCETLAEERQSRFLSLARYSEISYLSFLIYDFS